MKKIIALILAAMMLVVVFASCGGGDVQTATGDGGNTADNTSTPDYNLYKDANTGKGFDANITAKDFGDEKGASLQVWGPDKYIDLLKEQCKAFENKFKDQKISIKVSIQSEDSAGTKVQTDKAASADVFGFAADQINKLLASGCLKAISPKIAADIKATNVEEAVEVCKYKAGQYDALYAFPNTGNGYFLFYDNSVVSDEDAGSLEKVLEDCQKAGKKFIMDAGNGYYSCMFVFTGGLKLDGLEDDRMTQKFNDYDEAQVVASMKAFSKLMHDYKDTFQSDATTAVASGLGKKCGAGIDGSWDTQSIKDALGSKFGATKLPTINIDGTDTQIVSMYGYKLFGVNAASKYPKTSQVLAYYLASEECQKQRAEKLGWSPTNNAVIDTEEVQNDAAIKALIDQSKYSVAQANVGAIWTPFQAMGNKLFSKDTDPNTYDFKKLLNDTITNINM